MTQQQEEYRTRFTFHLLHFDGTIAEELTSLNFYANLKEFANVDLAIENSIEIEKTFCIIAEIFQNYLKQITVDLLYKNFDEYDWGVSPSTNQNSSAQYVFKLIDHNAAVRVNGKLSDEKEVRVIYEKSISANDFINPNPLSILPIWKDQEEQIGIRSLLKELLSKNKFNSRFKASAKKTKFKNVYSINSSQL